MGSSWLLVIVPSFFLLVVSSTSSTSLSKKSRCHDDEKAAMLSFKQAFVVNMSVSISSEPFARPKVLSWKLQHEGEKVDCCSWDGVECDDVTGHVVGLHLGSSYLYGFINSSSSLFSLIHLQTLDLSDNHFNYSQIPGEIAKLSRLSYLNLSNSVFSGQIPSEVLALTNLASLDLSYNGDPSYSWISLALVDNVDPPDNVRLLNLEGPWLTSLVQTLPYLEQLELSWVNISSNLPKVLSNMSSLRHIGLRWCGLYGSVLEDLFLLPKLEYLDLSQNRRLTGYIPEFHNTSYLLSFIDLSTTGFSGKIPFSIGNLGMLSYLNLRTSDYLNIRGNKFYGSLPSSLGNLTNLAFLSVENNKLSGQIPWQLGNLTNLFGLHLSYNELQGSIPNSFSPFSYLQFLDLSNNLLSGGIPISLTYLFNLDILLLSSNFLSGELPKSFSNLTFLYSLDLSLNQLSGALEAEAFIHMTSLRFLYLFDNKLTGKLPSSICSASNLSVLHLSKNNMDGGLAPCLNNISSSLTSLNLQGNKFSGSIPDKFPNVCNLELLDLSQNQLEGHIPRSLVRCKSIGVVNVGNNLLHDTFPSWLGIVSTLQILFLQNNQLHGTIKNPTSDLDFANLRMISLSGNNFSGNLPHMYFDNWVFMQFADAEDGLAMITDDSDIVNGLGYSYSITITNKGVNQLYKKILNAFIVVDFSNNKFTGEIPESIFKLQKLQALNLSNNKLWGPIPSSIQNLTNIESLDLSGNQLTGEIPPQMTGLNFLESLNLSSNQLVGPIPQGGQFDTFDDSSYLGNVGLCGHPLYKRCGFSRPSTPPTLNEEDNRKFPSRDEWISISAGVVSGLIVGIICGQYLAEKYLDRFLLKLGNQPRPRRTQKRHARTLRRER